MPGSRRGRSAERVSGTLPQVGFLTGDVATGHGWARYSLDVLRALQRSGLPMTIVSARNSPPDAGLEQQRLLPNTTPAARRLLARNLLAAPAVGRALRDCDVLHTLVEPYAICGKRTAGGRPHVVTAHGSYVRLLAQRPWPAGRMWRGALAQSQLVCVSRHTARVAREVLPGAAPVVIGNGIEARRFVGRDGARPRQGLTVLAVGAVKPRKGTLELVRAMARVIDALPQARCVIVGSTREAPGYVLRVREEIERRGLGGQVRLAGRVDEESLLSWYARAQVFALPSLNSGARFEGFGLAQLEASAAGLPVISTRDCGVEDAVEDGVSGLLLPQEGITEALAEAILRLLRDPQRAAAMGAAGRTRALQQTWERVAEQLLALYARLAGRGR